MKTMIRITKYDKNPITGFIDMEIEYLFGSKKDLVIDRNVHTSESNARAYFFSVASTAFKLNLEWWVMVCEKFQFGFLGEKHNEPGEEINVALKKCSEVARKYIKATAPLSTEYRKIYKWFLEAKEFFDRLHPPRTFTHYDIMDKYYQALIRTAKTMVEGDQFNLIEEFMVEEIKNRKSARA